MKVITIQATNFKGRTFRRELGALTIIAGPNDTGKTATVDAIKFALIDQIPGKAKSNREIFALASGKSLSVEAVVETGSGLLSVGRALTQSGDRIKATASADVEKLPPIPLVTFDAAEYFAAGPTGQLNMIFRLCPVETALPEELQKAAEAIIAESGQPPAFLPGGQTHQDWLEAALTKVGEALKTANAEVARMEKTLQGNAQIEATKGARVSPAEAERAYRAASTAADAAIAEAAKLEAAMNENSRKAARVAALNADIAAQKQIIGEWSPTEDLTEMQARLAAARIELGRVEERRLNQKAAQRQTASAKTALPDLHARLDAEKRLAAEAAELAKDIADFNVPEAPSEKEIEQRADALAEARREGASLLATIAEKDRAFTARREQILTLAKAGTCPTCGSCGENLASAITALAENEGRKFRQEAEKARDRLADLDAIIATRQNEFQTAANLRSLADTAKMKLAQSKDRLNARATAGVRVAELEKTIAEIEALAAPEIEPEPKALRESISELENDIRRMTARSTLFRLETELADIGTIDDAAGEKAMRADESMQSAILNRAETKVALDRANAQLQDDERQQRAADELAAAKERAAKIKDVQAGLKDAREQMVEAAFGPLLSTANKFVADIIPTPLEYRDGEIGRFHDGSWIPVWAFGGTFEAVTIAGLQAALGTACGIVIVDEMARMDGRNAMKFLDNVFSAIEAKRIEQFIGIDTDPKRYGYEDGVTVIETK